MKKRYELEDLDCAVCAARMEEAIKKIEGVRDAGVNFLTRKMTIDMEDGREAEIMEKVVKACRKVDKGCRILL